MKAEDLRIGAYYEDTNGRVRRIVGAQKHHTAPMRRAGGFDGSDLDLQFEPVTGFKSNRRGYILAYKFLEIVVKEVKCPRHS